MHKKRSKYWKGIICLIVLGHVALYFYIAGKDYYKHLETKSFFCSKYRDTKHWSLRRREAKKGTQKFSLLKWQRLYDVWSNVHNEEKKIIFISLQRVWSWHTCFEKLLLWRLKSLVNKSSSKTRNSLTIHLNRNWSIYFDDCARRANITDYCIFAYNLYRPIFVQSAQ